MEVNVPDFLPGNVTEPLKEHLLARQALISHEKRSRSDDAFRRTLSPTASKACDIVTRIRAEERSTIWRKPAWQNGEDDDLELYPGMMFTLAKERMEETKLWRIAKRMPKGTLLHCHMSATVDLEFLFNTTLDTPGMHFYSDRPLTSESARRWATILFAYSKETPQQTGGPLWTSEYVPNTLIPATEAAESFPTGGRAGFISWLKARSSIIEKESLEHHLGVDEVWRKFQEAFMIIGSVFYYEPILRAFTRKLLETLAEDGVQWVELREAFAVPYRRTGQDACDENFNNMIGHIAEEIEAFKASEKGRNFWGARVIWTALRGRGADMVYQGMQHCISAKKEYPHVVSGFDLVGQEDLGETYKALSPLIIHFQQLREKEGLEIPFFFHAGECLGDGDSTDENLFDAILFGTRRLGHGFSLYKHPDLIELVKRGKILIESCPISNEVLRLTSTVLAHPLPALLARGVPASLSNDDPALLGQGTSGMTHDFWEAVQAWDNLGLAGLGSLSQNSVRWAAFEDQNETEWFTDIEAGTQGSRIKAARMKEWKVSWEEFCQWIVDEFGD